MRIETMIDNYLTDVPGEEKPLFECDNCGFGIFEGEEFLEFDGVRICKDCISDLKKTAESEY